MARLLTAFGLLPVLALLLGLAIARPPALAHHGWAWTTGGNVEVTGIIKSARLGNPHGILELTVEAKTWPLEVSQPMRNLRAGIEGGDLAVGGPDRVTGEPDADPPARRAQENRKGGRVGR